MKRIISLLCSVAILFSIAACTSKKEGLSILCPSGAPALAFVSEYENIKDDGKIDIVEGSDVLIAELSKKNSEYDVIVAPVNLGAKLIEKEATEYRIAAILTWGNLYLVGNDEKILSKEGEIALFGQGSVPEKIYELSSTNINLDPVYYQSASLVQQQLLSGKAVAGMLAEPLASATIKKAKQNNIELSLIADLQKLSKLGEKGYPQAAIFVKQEKQCDALFKKIDDFTNHGYPDLKKYIENIGIETLQIPSIELALESMERQNIHYVKASECQKELDSFLKLFMIEFNEDMILDA